MNTYRKFWASVTAAGLSAAMLSGCAGGAGEEVSIVGFAVPASGNEAVAEAFNETEEGDGVEFSSSYGASGDQSRAVVSGQDADVAHISIEPDVTRLVDAGLVDDDWNSGPNNGYLTDSVVVLVVREGNPKDITDWEDLVREDVSIVSPNPGSSGAARWNILGAWGSVLQAGGTEEEAEEYLEKFIGNVDAFPGSGRDATTAFLDGTGDVLISYENEATLARQNGENFDYVVPDRNLLIENPAAVTTDADEKAEAFLDFALSPAGQEQYVTKGFRPLRHVEGEVEIGEVEGANDSADPFPEIADLYTIDGDYDGWDAVVDKFFDEDGIITRLINESGLA